ncbi:MAG: hypothetical protein COA61_007885 [Zetaproteobacteria bacterium]|nr:hypothetical protein [Zetaproteobacteria bacterium]MDQ6953027.1 hypothetical protein [Mariprofundaceae bacterium]
MSQIIPCHTQVYKIHELSTAWRNGMLCLYQKYYADSNERTFFADLDNKDYVILMQNSDENICGFSTLQVLETSFQGHSIRVIFSGDTIVHHTYWGKQDSGMFFLRLSGQIWQQADMPLYWLLISKGHRTYRYLSIFTKKYFPNFRKDASVWQQDLTHHLAKQQFGDSYNASTGVLSFNPPRERLKDVWTNIPNQHSHLPDVRFFLQKNPGFIHGDELVCLAELSPDNLKARAKRIFLQGAHASQA